MASTNTRHTQLRTFFFGLLCLLAGMMCVAKGFSHNAANLPAAVSRISGERQGVSPPSVILADIGNPQFTSLTPRYVTKRIADLEVGEEVVAKNPESGEVTTKRVANVFRKVSDHLRILQVRSPLTNELQTIETTDDHPFWVAALGQWIDAKDLKVGDRLDDVDGGTAILEFTSREMHPEGIPVFNFEVEDFHTYFVRAHGSRGPPVLTHNTECGPRIVGLGLESTFQSLRQQGAITFEALHTRGLADVDLRGVEDYEFIGHIEESLRRSDGLVFDLTGLNFRRVAEEGIGFGKPTRFTDPITGRPGNTTSKELVAVLRMLPELQASGKQIRFLSHGRDVQVADELGKAFFKAKASDLPSLLQLLELLPHPQ